MNSAWCPKCGNEVRLSPGGTEMEWEFEGRTKRLQGDFYPTWVCPFCHPDRFLLAESISRN